MGSTSATRWKEPRDDDRQNQLRGGTNWPYRDGDEVRLVAARALWRLGVDVRASEDGILPILEDPESPFRAIAAGALGLVGGERAAAALERALSDDDPEVRCAAAGALPVVRGRLET